jgi:hypothetical protein
LTVLVRLWFLRRLFGELPILRHVAGGVGPTIPPVAVVIGLRFAHSWTHSATWTAVEALCYTVVAAVATYLWQGALLREALGYLRRRRPVVAV